MARIPKGSLVKGPYKPICVDCTIYFSTTVVELRKWGVKQFGTRNEDFLVSFPPINSEVWRLFTSTLWLKAIRSLDGPNAVDCKGVFFVGKRCVITKNPIFPICKCGFVSFWRFCLDKLSYHSESNL